MHHTPPQKYCLFLDLDGTLINSQLDIANSINFTLQKLQLPKLSIPLISSHIGHGLTQLIQKCLQLTLHDNSNPNTILKQAILIFREHYSHHLLDSTQCYPHVLPSLNQLSHIQKAIITNKSKQPTLQILQKLSILHHFPLIISADDVTHKKPHPEPVLKAIQTLNVKPQSAIMIGDNYTDIQSAQSAQVHSCFASYGMGSIQNIQPDFVIHSFRQILQFFSKPKTHHI